MRRSAAVCMVVVAVAFCACGSLPVTTDFSFPNFALKNWHKFPADQVPRPIVRLTSQPHPDAPGVFSSTAAEAAFYCNTFTSRGGSLPSDVPTEAHASWKFGTTVTYASISAADAAAALASRPNPYSSPDCKNVAPVVLTSARLGSAQFDTDRGPAEMTAWFFTLSGSTGELPFPAIASSAFWDTAEGIKFGSGGAFVSKDGMSLLWTFIGAPTQGRCSSGYKTTFKETSTAIAIKVQETSSPPGDCILDLFGGAPRSVSVSLASPLGGRVVVDDEGMPGGVSPIQPWQVPN